VGAVPVAVNGGERREGAVGGSGRSSGVVDGGGGEVAVTCHSVIITLGGGNSRLCRFRLIRLEKAEASPWGFRGFRG
jgi:hypothetical protein